MLGLHAETDKALKEAVYNRLADQSKYESLQAANEVVIQLSLLSRPLPFSRIHRNESLNAWFSI